MLTKKQSFSGTGYSASAVRTSWESDNPVELGRVNWLRDYDQAMAKAQETNKPILILFQEVPGCLNCQRYGREVMGNPLVVDVIENEFVPLCIYNNKRGKDAEILKKFREPSWNNPVVRIIDTNEKELTQRMSRFHPVETINGIANALTSVGRDIPTYFQLLQEESNAKIGKTEKAVFSMHCFWTGELKLGQLEGVVNTVPGFMNGREVVEVTFDPSQTSYEDLLKDAKQANAIDGAFTVDNNQKEVATEVMGKSRDVGQFRIDREPKYYMSHTLLKHIPMLAKQRIEVNRSIYQRSNPMKFLSPSQIALYQQIKEQNTQLDDFSLSEDIVGDWEKVLGAGLVN